MQTSLFPVGIIIKDDTDFDLIEFINGRKATTKSGKRVKFIALLSDETTRYPLIVEIAGELVNYTRSGKTCVADDYEDYSLRLVGYSNFLYNEVSPTASFYRMNPKTKRVESRWRHAVIKSDGVIDKGRSEHIWN